MRGDRTALRGEAARVAERVRVLLEREDDAAAEPHAEGDAASAASHVAYGRHDYDLDDDDGSDGDDPHDEALLAGLAGARRRPPVRSDATVADRLFARLPVRVDPGRRSALAIGVAVLLAALITGIWLMSSRPHSVAVSSGSGNGATVPGAGPLVGTDGATEAAVSPSPSTASTSSSTTQLVIDVAGKVRRPGVYRLRAGSRIIDAVTAAGGPKGHVSLSSLNLAALLVDGQQVAVGVPAAAGGAAVVGGGDASAAASGGASGTVVDINTATLEQLETLPGVGPVLGQDILDYRTQHGSFANVEQLKDVSGIGDITFAKMQPLVTV